LQEKLIDSEQLTIFGLHCPGAVAPEKIRAVTDCGNDVEAVEICGDAIKVISGKKTSNVSLKDGALAKCFRCTEADAQNCDQFIGEHGAPPTLTDAPAAPLDQLEAMSMEERFRFWEEQMSQCIRCYACRSACPLCVCQDHCAAQSREPHWLDQTDHPREKLMFQAMHALHTAGRCTECGECERACPVGLPIMTMKLALNRQIKTLFDYEAGRDPESTPPLFQFRETEEHIKERKW
jgi:formate dehydrogenase subunit beta